MTDKPATPVDVKKAPDVASSKSRPVGLVSYAYNHMAHASEGIAAHFSTAATVGAVALGFSPVGIVGMAGLSIAAAVMRGTQGWSDALKNPGKELVHLATGAGMVLGMMYAPTAAIKFASAVGTMLTGAATSTALTAAADSSLKSQRNSRLKEMGPLPQF